MRLPAVLLAVLLLAAPALASEAEPFVQDGRIVATIVVGADAPATDVILGAEVAAYLQGFAKETATGLAKTSDAVDLSDGGVYVLIGTPEHNPLVAETLGLSAGDRLDGPFLQREGSVMVLSGSSDADVAAAADLFRAGLRQAGAIIRVVADDPTASRSGGDGSVDDPQPEGKGSDPQDASGNVSVQEEDAGMESGSAVPAAQDPSCEPARFCEGNVVRSRGADCVVQSEFCTHGCADGACRVGFWERLFSFFAFWR